MTSNREFYILSLTILHHSSGISLVFAMKHCQINKRKMNHYSHAHFTVSYFLFYFFKLEKDIKTYILTFSIK